MTTGRYSQPKSGECGFRNGNRKGHLHFQSILTSNRGCRRVHFRTASRYLLTRTLRIRSEIGGMRFQEWKPEGPLTLPEHLDQQPRMPQSALQNRQQISAHKNFEDLLAARNDTYVSHHRPVRFSTHAETAPGLHECPIVNLD